MFTEPRATYRVQLHAGFGFEAAAAIADYLAKLGMSHLYCSPYFQAARGSMHGYDVVNHRKVNDELGGASGHSRLCDALRRWGLGQVLDLVPNHMATGGPENPWWWDVLENGPSSRYASYFDVDWDPPEARLRNVVLLPVLGDHYGRVLEAGELRLAREGAAFTVRYHDLMFPVAPRSLRDLLAAAAARSLSDALAFISDAFHALPLPTATDWVSVHRRHRNQKVLMEQLARLMAEQPHVAAAVDAAVTEINADPNALHALLERQNYRLALWRAAHRDLGYRRFFDINTLVGLRVDDERVFADTHSLVLRWMEDKVLDGLRIDHVDGLRDPEAYLRRLDEKCPGAWIVVEKILMPDEQLRDSWPIAGTTGYDFLNRVGGLFVDPAGEGALTRLYADFTGEPTDYADLAHAKKHYAMRETLGSDVNRLTALLLEICEQHRRHRDYTRHELQEALREVIACFPVYRTYVLAEPGKVSDDDVRYVSAAIASAKAHRSDLDGSLFDFLCDLLLLRFRGERETEFVMRLQQLTGPVMAKGIEDTAFYCFNRLVSLNEVGGDPSRFGMPVDEFYRACGEAHRRWPRTMLTTSSHDTKRSEDVRARLALLSEIPERWAEAVRRWSAINERHRHAGLTDRNAEYLLYQTLVGAWPISAERVVAYMEKVSREAKVYTSWTSPDTRYESALKAFVEGACHDGGFIADLETFVAPLIEPGRVNSLAQVLIKLTAPGIPDTYQGTELWDLSLVDPDNRRPVDYELRRRLLSELDGATPEEIWRKIDEGLPKLWVIRQALALRGKRPGLFGPEGYFRPLCARGIRAQHVVAFARGDGAVTVVPRLVIGLGGDWADTTLELPDGPWLNLLSDDRIAQSEIRLDELLDRFPVCLLSREEPNA